MTTSITSSYEVVTNNQPYPAADKLIEKLNEIQSFLQEEVDDLSVGSSKQQQIPSHPDHIVNGINGIDEIFAINGTTEEQEKQLRDKEEELQELYETIAELEELEEELGDEDIYIIKSQADNKAK
ncbi:2896_t:CDS:2 [Diversispora eburnea]|uniref:2896_t:CDS:1 n=1 Tax=Diversispora eburnea TaxID=1213867 RepID=A0A9N9C3F9_9GLOM|nr:2896_t:CDS:2 [Diversispora eburnea]